jgi:hypothetical protein
VVDSEIESAKKLNEDRFTEREAQAFLKVVGRDQRVVFFRDLKLIGKAIVNNDTALILPVMLLYLYGQHQTMCIATYLVIP